MGGHHPYFLGFRYSSSICQLMTYSPGAPYTKGGTVGQLYTKEMLKTEVVTISDYVSHDTNMCQSLYTASPSEIPEIEMTQPPPVPTFSTTTWGSMYTAQPYISVSVTDTVSSETITVLGADLQNLSDNIRRMKPANMSHLTLFTNQLLDLVLESPDDLRFDLRRVRDIENQISSKMSLLPAGELNMNSTISSYLTILGYAYGFESNNSCQQRDQMIELRKLEDEFVNLAKLYLKLQNTNKSLELNWTSVSITVGAGRTLGEQYTTAYGSAIIENVEILRKNLANQKLMTLVISYKQNAFFRLQTEAHVNIPVITTSVFDIQGRELPDVYFKMRFPVPSHLDTDDNYLDMISNRTHYMAALPAGFLNGSSALVSVDISMMKSCQIYGKYGTTSPTSNDFDFYLNTKGLTTVTKYRPYGFPFYFTAGGLQLPVTQTPVIITAQCQARGNTEQGSAPRIRINPVLPQVIDRKENNWKPSHNLQLAGGRKSEITLKSSFFGTFSASIKLIPPDTIDFLSVFLNFSEKLHDTPYVLATVLTVIISLVMATPILYKLDYIDSVLWSYEWLLDNKPESPFDYYICVSTGVRSKRQMKSLVYINIIGTRGETGARLLTGNNRQNFGNGTSCNFLLKSDVFLGNIKTVKIWLGGHVETQSWYLNRIIIIDGKTRNLIRLKCNAWLSQERGTGQIWRTLRVGRKRNNVSSLSEISARNLFDDHLWFSLLFRPRYSRFSRVQRLWSVVSLLFLSMVASAMFYDTPNDTLPFLNVANFELGYKELYTGLMSSVITVVPSLIITYIFSNRKRLGEKPLCISNDYEPVRSSGNLPWWSIFIAYTVLLIGIISGSFFTLMYSLEWGRSLTLKWMSSFFLGTTQSVLLIDPTKAIILAVILVCLCSEKANLRDFNLPPISSLDKQQESAGQGHQDRRGVDEECPCDKPLSTKQNERRYMLHRDRKLNRLLRRFTFGLLYIALVVMIGSHQQVSDLYGQNMHLKNIVRPTQEVKSIEDVWKYIHSVVLKRLYPSELNTFGNYYKMGPIRLRQIRVKGTCAAPSMMKMYGITCSPAYDEDTEDTNDYSEGWLAENMSTLWNEHGASYRYHDDPMETPPYSGYSGTYGGGGYLVDLGVSPTKTNDSVQRLHRHVWLDGRTRAVFIEACLVNRNNMIFTQITVLFEFPSTGGIFKDITVVSSNLYPYTNTFDYIILLLQIVFVMTILGRLLKLVYQTIKTQGRSFFTLTQVNDMLHLGVSIATVVCLAMRFTSAITVLNTLRQDMGFYTSFGYVFYWDGYYALFLGLTTFLATLDLLSYLEFNYQVFLMNKTMIAFRREVFHFTLALSVVMFGFASLSYLIYGHTESSFRSIPYGVLTLFRMTIGMIKFRNDIEVASLDIFFIIAIYAAIVTIFFVNIFTSSLNTNISDIKKLIKDGKTNFDWYLSRHFWNCLARVIAVCGLVKPSNQAAEEDNLHNVDLRQLEVAIDRFVAIAMELLNEEKNARMEKENLRCRRRMTFTGIQYRYSNNWEIEDNTLTVEFLDEVVACRVDIVTYTIREAISLGMVKSVNSTDPVSAFYKISIPSVPSRRRPRAFTWHNEARGGRMNSWCNVVVKVPPSEMLRLPVYLISRSANHGEWHSHRAQQSTSEEGEVYLSATIPYCPRYIFAVASDLPSRIPPFI